MLDPTFEARVQSALSHLNHDDRNVWVRAGMCIKAEFAEAGFALWDEWSSQGETYKACDAKSVWKSFKKSGLNIETLFFDAKAKGWKDDTKHQKPSAAEIQQRKKARAEQEAIAAAQQETADAIAAEIFGRCNLATPSHPYIIQKKAEGVPLEGLGVLPDHDELCIVGESMAGALVVPIRRTDGSISSLQFIVLPEVAARLKSKGRSGKVNLPKAKMEGFHTVGEVTPDGVIYVAEGLPTAWSCWQATETASVACFGWGRVLTVAKILRVLYPFARLVLVPDVGKEESANKIATEVGAAVAYMPHGWANNSDASDLAQRDGHDELAKLLEDACIPATWPVAVAVADVLERDKARREVQQNENRSIQELAVGWMIPAKFELNEMLQNLYWIAEGEAVGHAGVDHTMFLSFKEFRSLTAESTTALDSLEGQKRRTPNAVLWQRDPQRNSVMTRTFRAGAEVVCSDPDGKRAINTWRPLDRWMPKAEADVKLFLEHVAYLIQDEAECKAFLDWLAHIEQSPGTLPHYGWLHVANHTGCGRNWLASVLARVWKGTVAPNVDLPALLESSFNDCLAGRVLAIVDEIQEGGAESYRQANRLRSLVNPEFREINPKFGRKYKEHNACRWLVFSNHTDAIKIDNKDRRWRIVVHNDKPRSPEIHEQLYGALADPEFINAVAVHLRNRDISRFKPGERPPMNEAKRAVVSASKSILHQYAEDLLTHWPSDAITTTDVANILTDGEGPQDFKSSMRRILEELGAVSHGSQIKLNGYPMRVWFIRNVEKWVVASNSDIRREVALVRPNKIENIKANSILAEASEAAALRLTAADQCGDEPPI
jgi:phage/plasmid primase-like uncharacterized protein